MSLLLTVLFIMLLFVVVDRIAGLGWIDGRVWQIFMIIIAVIVIWVILAAVGFGVPAPAWGLR